MPIVADSDGADESDDDFGDGDFDGAFDEDEDDDDGALTPCPHCDRPIHEESQKCEHCGEYVTQEFIPWRRPWWLVVGVVLCLFAVYLWMRH